MTAIKHLSDSSIIYCTGLSCRAKPLIGGVWTLWHQEGFPLEMSYLEAKSMNCEIDWCEAMFDASRSNNCPALMDHAETFLPSETLFAMKVGFMRVLRSGKTPEQVVAEKRANGRALQVAMEQMK